VRDKHRVIIEAVESLGPCTSHEIHAHIGGRYMISEISGICNYLPQIEPLGKRNGIRVWRLEE